MESDKQFVERMQKHFEVYASSSSSISASEIDRLLTLALRGAEQREIVSEMLLALRGVVRVADRATDEFDAARAAIAKAEQEVL